MRRRNARSASGAITTVIPIVQMSVLTTGCRSGSAALSGAGPVLPHSSRTAWARAEIGFHSAIVRNQGRHPVGRRERVGEEGDREHRREHQVR